MKRTNFSQKSSALLYAFGFLLFFLVTSTSRLSAQNSSPIPPLVSIQEAINILHADLEDLRHQQPMDMNLWSKDALDVMHMETFVLNELKANQSYVGYQTLYAVHLVATNDVYNQLVNSGATTIEVDPFNWIYTKYKSDKNYQRLVSLLKK